MYLKLFYLVFILMNLKRNYHLLVYVLIQKLFFECSFSTLEKYIKCYFFQFISCFTCEKWVAIALAATTFLQDVMTWFIPLDMLKGEYFAFLTLLYKLVVSSLSEDNKKKKSLDADRWNHFTHHLFYVFSNFDSFFFLITCEKVTHFSLILLITP